ncbi:MAG: 50S ribosomal protein L18 [Anaerolineaceae bacterium]|nr:50S ribosomal protein L18 [Anaerolineaceae bacterium]MCY3907923.1 50S ribosomal protein L18 [Anaerolineaceae bacterium]MDD9954895.1 50S ribosomal protein L18 [Anaerolineaceae bacterium]MDE0328651.1 50S ribosomal protein L18 [Anaerolineaceae bacterium]MDE0610894.1 50S ribosomal protein L18 [Anaerolineaceae bacterium]
MDASKRKHKARERRHRRLRARVQGSSEQPRLCVYRSLTNIYAQLIDDGQGHTLVAASTIDRDLRAQVADKSPIEAARMVGQLVGERARQAGVKRVVFDRGGYRYHGRVAALAEGARAAGLDF